MADLGQSGASAREIVAAVDEALRRAAAPICYLHRDGTEGAFAVVVRVEQWLALMAMIPEGDAINDLVMYHGHIEGDEDEQAEGGPRTSADYQEVERGPSTSADRFQESANDGTKEEQ